MPLLNTPKNKISFTLFGNNDGAITITKPNNGNDIIFIKLTIKPTGIHKNNPIK